MLELIGAAIVAFLAGVIGTIGGGGGLPGLTYLLFIGFPIDNAIATMRMAAIGIISGSMANFHKGDKIDWKILKILAPIGLAGGIIGGNFLVSVDKDLIEQIIGFVLLAIVPTLYIKKDLGLRTISKSNLSKTIGYIIFFFCSIFAGLVGPGSAFLFIIVLIQFFGFTTSRALATQLAAFGLIVVSTFLLFAYEGLVDYKYGLILMTFGAIGGFIGSKVTITKGDYFVKTIMTSVILLASIKLLIL